MFDITDEEGGKSEIESDCEKYLGDWISIDAKDTKYILARKAKRLGIVKQILGKLEDICFGHFYFESP